jgi:hypothetical protein
MNITIPDTIPKEIANKVPNMVHIYYYQGGTDTAVCGEAYFKSHEVGPVDLSRPNRCPQCLSWYEGYRAAGGKP